MASSFQLVERSYGGKKFRPKAKVYNDEANNLLICVTPWGVEEVSDIVIDSIKNFLASAGKDDDATVPYARKDSLNRLGNVLRMAIMMASERIHKEYNSEIYSAGFEIFAGFSQGRQWTYVCCGQPSLVLLRKGVGAIPIHHNLDLNTKISHRLILDPLPSHLLGIGQHPPIQFGNLSLTSKDQLMLISRSYLPQAFFAIPERNRNLNSVSETLAKDNPDIPFWAGLVQF